MSTLPIFRLCGGRSRLIRWMALGGVGRFSQAMAWFRSPFAGFIRSDMVRGVGRCLESGKPPPYYWLRRRAGPGSVMAQTPLDNPLSRVGRALLKSVLAALRAWVIGEHVLGLHKGYQFELCLPLA